MELDKAAELAAEAGYIEAHDISLLMDAIDREQRGEAGPGMGANMEAVARQQDLDTLEELVGMAGIDLETMSNEEARAKLEAMDTLSQDRITPSGRARMDDRGAGTPKPGDWIRTEDGFKFTVLDDGTVTDGDMSWPSVDEFVSDMRNDPNGSIAWEILPSSTIIPISKGKTFFQEEALTEYLVRQVEEVQDFGDLTITEDKTVQGTGQTVKVSQAASTKFDRAVKRRNVAKQLMDCISA